MTSDIGFEEIDLTIQCAARYTAEALTRELKKHGLLKLEQTAFERTVDDIHTFKLALKLLADESVSQDGKRHIAQFVQRVQRALKRMQVLVSEQEFIMFYQFKVNGQTQRTLAAHFGIDVSTVRRTAEACINQLSLYLHPDLYLKEILN